MEFTLGVLVENQPGVLSRVAGLFSRRGFNIESLAVGPTDEPDVSRITLRCQGDERTREKLTKQLEKQIDVLEVWHLPPSRSVVRELALVKVHAGASQRQHIMQIADVFRAKVVDVGRETLILEVTGDTGKVNALLELVREFGIQEVVRTGTIAMARGSDSSYEEEDATWRPFTTTGMPM